jgi:uncharacterized protein YjiS (DUF1127 family)
MTFGTHGGRIDRWWHLLREARHDRRQAAHLDTLSDHMRRDIGMPRNQFDRIHITAFETTMRMLRIL